MNSFLRSIFKQKYQHILLVGAQKIIGYKWANGELKTTPKYFDRTEQGYQHFQYYLSDAPNIPMTIVLDIADETYQEENIPHVFGKDRKSVINRRLTRLFHNAKYYYADIQNRQTSGRRDDNILCIAITNNDALSFWLPALEQQKIPLAAICSLPLLSTQLLPLLTDKLPKHLLLVTLHETSGLRQSYFRKGQLKISRSIRLSNYVAEDYPNAIASEVSAINTYLGNNYSITEDNPLVFYILACGKLKQQLADVLLASRNSTYHVLDITTFLPKKLKTKQIDFFSDVLLSYNVQQKRISNHYALPKERQVFKRYKLQGRLFLCASLFTLIALCYSIFTAIDGLLLQQKIASLKLQTDNHQAVYNEAKESFIQIPITSEQLILINSMADELAQKSQGGPFMALSTISQVLAKFPGITINEITWEKQLKRQNMPEIEGHKGPYQTALILAEITKMKDEPKKMMAQINHFISTLKTIPTIFHIEKIKSPGLKFSPNNILIGETKKNELDNVFTLKVFMRM